MIKIIRSLSGLLIFIWLMGLTACQRDAIPVQIVVEGQTITRRTNAQTVRDLLVETDIPLNNLDKVEPDLYRSVIPGMTVRVIRVTETSRNQTTIIPFEHRVVINEALPQGEQRLAQLGVNGEEEIITRITFEDGIEVNRTEVSRTIVRPPIEELMVIGGKGSLSTVSFNGLVAYISGGNAWLMKNNNAARRPLTTSGDLDGRAFDLSADGETLLYTRAITRVMDAPLNELWLVNTRIVGEEPVSTPITGVLYAQWSPVATHTLIAYSTGQRVPSQPGWRANNDLWLWDVTSPADQAINLIPANTSGLYPWWGTGFVWSPNGSYFAYANANRIGIINVISKTVTPLVNFAPYQTNSEWVWIPGITWSPDSNFIATVVHGPPQHNEPQEASEVFDLWLFAANGSVKAKVWEQVGMWSNPVWYANGIGFGRAVDPLRSSAGTYKLATIDGDGSNQHLLFPLDEAMGLTFPQMSWQADGKAVIFEYRHNLYLLPVNGLPAQPLTADNQSQRPVWVSLPVSPSRAISTTNVTTSPVTPTTRIITTFSITR